MLKHIQRNKNEKGFTLVEILVVIVIIGILFTVILPRIDFASDRARETGIKTDFRTYTTAAEQYLRQQNGNNLTTEGLNSWLDKVNQVDGDALDAIVDTGKKDPWSKNYEIQMKDFANNDTIGQIVIQSSGKSGGAFDNEADYILGVYYREGIIETCTIGFDSGNIHMDFFESTEDGGPHVVNGPGVDGGDGDAYPECGGDIQA